MKLKNIIQALIALILIVAAVGLYKVGQPSGAAPPVDAPAAGVPATRNAPARPEPSGPAKSKIGADEAPKTVLYPPLSCAMVHSGRTFAGWTT